MVTKALQWQRQCWPENQSEIKQRLNVCITDTGLETCFGWDPPHPSVLGSDSKTHLKSRFVGFVGAILKNLNRAMFLSLWLTGKNIARFRFFKMVDWLKFSMRSQSTNSGELKIQS